MNYFKKNNIWGKGTYKDNYTLLFIFQLLCFIKREKIDNLYNQIKRKFKNEKYKNFFDYFSRILLSSRCPKNLCDFNDIINGKDSKKILI